MHDTKMNMSYYIAMLYNNTLKIGLQKKKVSSKSSAKQKKCPAKVLQSKKSVQQKFCKTKKSYASTGFEPVSVSTTTSGRCLQ